MIKLERSGTAKKNYLRIRIPRFGLLILFMIITTSCSWPANPPIRLPVVKAPVIIPPVNKVGSVIQPIRVIFSPTADPETRSAGSKIFLDAMAEATGLFFKPIFPATYTEATTEMCASRNDTIGLLTGLGYVLTNRTCAAQVSLKAIRADYDVFWTAIFVPRESEIDSLDDLHGLKWGYGDPGYTTDYLVPLFMFNEAGVVPGSQIQTGNPIKSLEALYNGEVDFSTSYYGPPLDMESGKPFWPEESADIPGELVESCHLTDDGAEITCGSLNIQDARLQLRKTMPDVMRKIRILAISSDLPNDAFVFSAAFPTEVRVQIEEALSTVVQSDQWRESIGKPEFYGWEGLTTAENSDYEILRIMVDTIWPDLLNPGTSTGN